MENPEKKLSPSLRAPTEAMLEVEFQRKTLGTINMRIREFAVTKDITYDVEKNLDDLLIRPDPEDFEALDIFLVAEIKELNDMLASHGKSFSFEIDYRHGSFFISAKTLKHE